MKSYSINDSIQISVFPKTGTTFLDTMSNEYDQIKLINNQISEIFNTDMDKHYISIREPLDRFISGFISMYYRSLGKYHGDPFLKNKNLELFDKIKNLDLCESFDVCLDFYQNDWSFDKHIINVYKDIDQLCKNNNIVFLNFSDIGNFLDSLGFTIRITEEKNLHYYTNHNPKHDKNILKEMILNNQSVYNSIKEYLQPDIIVYNNWTNNENSNLWR